MPARTDTVFPITEEDLEIVPCPLCGSEKYHEIIQIKPEEGNTPGTRYIDRTFSLVTCDNCTMTFTNPRPKIEWSLRRYNSPHSTEVAKNRNKFYHQLNAFSSYPGGIAIIKKWKKSGKLLDIGSSVGVFIALAELSGFDAYGNEVDKGAADIGQVIVPEKVIFGDVFDISLKKDDFDVVTLWNVIEHLREPIRMMERAHEVLRPSGVIYLETPNATLPILRSRGFLQKLKKPTFLWPYEHIMFFTPRSIRYGLKKAGFSRVEVYTHGWQTAFRHGNLTEAGGYFSHLQERVKKNGYQALNFMSGGALNFMPVMTVVAQK